MPTSKTSYQPPYAMSPFDDPDADFVIRTSDNADFRVHKAFLTTASPVFKDMFALPMAKEKDVSQEYRDGAPVVELVDDARTIQNMLCIIYPFQRPDLATLEDVYAVLRIGEKYGMDHVLASTIPSLMRYAETEPLRIFGIAYRFGFTQEARIVAQQTIRYPMLPLPSQMPKEIVDLPIAIFYNLLQYHRKCREAVDAVFTDLGWTLTDIPNFSASRIDNRIITSSSWIWFSDVSHSHCAMSPRTFSFVLEGVEGRACPRAWWTDYIAQAKAASQVYGWRAALTSPEVLEPAFRQASRCPTCGKEVYKHLTAFASHLADKIDFVIAEITLQLEEIASN
ncbi:hypothetical protein OBBRIDRAFT_885268 [Obba rivulosa]|uniref:BTB domain-containing protein n=1 Tax=Obba rivulosa TaxID=1052685 RepID=A0A8E2DQ56_9APHY|nr:hypothetical protein OBBRIDRAFT_885268 [Obba rivulosa]